MRFTYSGNGTDKLAQHHKEEQELSKLKELSRIKKKKAQTKKRKISIFYNGEYLVSVSNARVAQEWLTEKEFNISARTIMDYSLHGKRTKEGLSFKRNN